MKRGGESGIVGLLGDQHLAEGATVAKSLVFSLLFPKKATKRQQKQNR